MKWTTYFFHKWLWVIGKNPAAVVEFIERRGVAKGGELEAILALAED